VIFTRSNLLEDPRHSLAEYLNVEFEEWQQDWEYEISSQVDFTSCINLYQASFISDEQRESLVEIMLDKVANEFAWEIDVTLHPFWIEIESILKSKPSLHADTVTYWQGFEAKHAYGAVSARLKTSFKKIPNNL